MITFVFVGIIVLSLAVIGLLLALRSAAVGGRAGSARPSLVARLLTLWVVATVFFGGYFGAIRVPGLFDITVERVLFCVLLTAMAGVLLRKRVRFNQKPTLDVLLGIFAGLCLVSMGMHGFFPSHPGLEKPWYTFLSGYLLPFFAFFGAKYFLVSEADDRCVMAGLFWMGVLITGIALLEGLGLRDFVWPRYIADRTILIHLDRARGPFLNAAFNGTALCIGLLAGISLLPLRRPPGRLVSLFLLCLFVPAIYYTRTRSVYLQLFFIVGGLVTVFHTSFPKWKVYAIPAFLIFLALVANWQRLESSKRTAGGLGQMQQISIRFELAAKAVRLFEQHPLFGVGLSQFRSITNEPYAETDMQHNHLIGLAAELGIVGLGVYLAILVVILRRLFGLLTVMPERRFYNSNFVFLLGLALLSSLISNSFVEPTPHPFANINFFLLAGMVDRLVARFARPSV